MTSGELPDSFISADLLKWTLKPESLWNGKEGIEPLIGRAETAQVPGCPGSWVLQQILRFRTAPGSPCPLSHARHLCLGERSVALNWKWPWGQDQTLNQKNPNSTQ